MSYRCGFGPGMQALGVEPCDPHAICDGCGAKVYARPGKYGAPAWIRKGTAPPGWRMLRMHDGSKRWDLCPSCWKEPQPGGDHG